MKRLRQDKDGVVLVDDLQTRILYERRLCQLWDDWLLIKEGYEKQLIFFNPIHNDRLILKFYGLTLISNKSLVVQRTDAIEWKCNKIARMALSGIAINPSEYHHESLSKIEARFFGVPLHNEVRLRATVILETSLLPDKVKQALSLK